MALNETAPGTFVNLSNFALVMLEKTESKEEVPRYDVVGIDSNGVKHFLKTLAATDWGAAVQELRSWIRQMR